MMVGVSDFVTVDSLLAILSIVIGLAIFLMQRSADSKINGIIETQFRRQELEKNYFGTRVQSNLELIKRNYGKLAQYLSEYLRDHSQNSRNKAKNFCSFQATNLDEYVVPAMRNDLGRLIPFIDDLKLVDQLSEALDDFASIYKDCCVDGVYLTEDEVKTKVESALERSRAVETLLASFTNEIPKDLNQSGPSRQGL